MNLKKAEIQEKAFKSWNHRGRLEMCTGSGKSRVAVMAAMQEPGLIYLIVPTEKLRDENWKEEFNKWGNLEVYQRIKRICYASASKIAGETVGLVICDEIHRLTPLSYKFFTQNSVDKVLGLTATMPEDPERRILIDKVAPQQFKYSLNEGVQDGVVSPFEIHVIQLNLNNTLKNIPAGSKKKPFMTTEAGQYAFLDKIQRKNMFEGNIAASQAWAQKRMHFLYNLPSKTKLAKNLLPYLSKDKRLIVFCGSINQATEIHTVSFHSLSKDESLNKFINKEENILTCVNMLNEGMNIPDVDSALVVQLNSKELDLIQRIGRVVRWRENHLSKIYILSVINTRDEIWLEKALANFDREITPIFYHHAESFLRHFSQNAETNL